MAPVWLLEPPDEGALDAEALGEELTEDVGDVDNFVLDPKAAANVGFAKLGVV